MSGTGGSHPATAVTPARGLPTKVVRRRERWSGRGADSSCAPEGVVIQRGQIRRRVSGYIAVISHRVAKKPHSDPMNSDEMADASEFGVAGDDGRVVIHRAGEQKAVGVRDAIAGFVLSRLIDELVGNRQDREVEPVDMGQHLDLPFIPKSAFRRIQDFAKVNRAEILRLPPTRRGPEPLLDDTRTALSLEQGEEGMAIKDERVAHAKSCLWSFRSCLASEGLFGRHPIAALIGSATGGTMWMMPPHSKICSAVPGVMWYFFRRLAGMTSCPFASVLTVSIV